MLDWPVAELLKHKDAPLAFNTTVDAEATLMARDPEIQSVSLLEVSGYVSLDDGDIITAVTVKGSMVVPSTRSLTPVTLPLNLTFSEIYVLDEAAEAKYEDGELVMLLDGDRLDLLPAVLDHVLLSIPMQVLSPQEEAEGQMPSGTDWNVISEADYQETAAKEERPNPEFEKLKALFNDQEDTDK